MIIWALYVEVFLLNGLIIAENVLMLLVQVEFSATI